MIASLRGEVLAVEGATLVVEVGGVGYRLHIPSSLIPTIGPVGAEVLLYTHLLARENEVALYGFAEVSQLEMFEALIEVNGVGPKVALALISAYRPDAIASAISVDDIALLSSVPGIGTKTAQRIAIDLKGKVAPALNTSAPVSDAPPTSALGDAHAALDAMGFSSAEIHIALRGVDASQETPLIIADALRNLGGARA